MIAHLKKFNLEKESLLASGAGKNEQLFQYTQKLESLFQKFVSSGTLPSELVAKAEALFKWLWIERPARYKPHGNFRLTDVIDAQLSKDSQAVGNCLGLTLLYNCLLRKMGIYAEALYLKEAFGIRPHVLTAYSDANRPPIPIQTGHLFRSNPASHSEANRPPSN